MKGAKHITLNSWHLRLCWPTLDRTVYYRTMLNGSSLFSLKLYNSFYDEDFVFNMSRSVHNTITCTIKKRLDVKGEGHE